MLILPDPSTATSAEQQVGSGGRSKEGSAVFCDEANGINFPCRCVLDFALTLKGSSPLRVNPVDTKLCFLYCSNQLACTSLPVHPLAPQPRLPLRYTSSPAPSALPCRSSQCASVTFLCCWTAATNLPALCCRNMHPRLPLLTRSLLHFVLLGCRDQLACATHPTCLCATHHPVHTHPPCRCSPCASVARSCCWTAVTSLHAWRCRCSWTACRERAPCSPPPPAHASPRRSPVRPGCGFRLSVIMAHLHKASQSFIL